MSAEIDCYRLRAKQEDILEGSFSIEPGGSGFVLLSKSVRLVTQCEKENKRCSVLITGQNLRARLTLKIFEDGGDKYGKYISFRTNKPIWVEGDQQLSILYRKYLGKEYYDRELYIYLDSDNGDSREIPIAPEGELQPIIS